MMRRLAREVGALFRRRRADEALDAELSFHLEMQAARYVREGHSPAEARRLARVDFGGVERHREAAMAVRRGRPVEDLVRDLRHGVRQLVRSPAYAVITMVTLALGIGAATAMFSIADAVVLRPLVYGGADRLYTLYEAREDGGIRTPSYPSFRDWEREVTAFEALTFIRGDEFRLRGAEGTQRLLAGYVSAGFFRTLGTPPALGRVFESDEQDARVVVLSHELWQRRFGGDAGILGSSILTADGGFTVVGVMPQGFRIPGYADLWAPLHALPADATHALTRRDLHVDSEVWGLVREGVTVEQAQADLERVIRGLADVYAELAGDWTHASVIAARDQILGGVGAQVRILAAAVALLLLIVCVNVAGLQIARGTTRAREMAVRAALGAGRGRLFRQLVSESLLLALIGGALGALLAWYLVPALAAAFPFALPRLDEVGVDVRALAFAACASIIAALVSGTLPARRAAAPVLAPALREGGGAGGSGTASRTRSALVIAQVALAITLTAGAGLLLRSLWSLQQVDPGFTADGVVALRVFPPAHYAAEEAARTLYSQLQEAAERVPGVRSAALSNHVPFAGGWMVTRVVTGGAPPAGSDLVIIRTVSPEYFEVMGTRRSRGRLLTADDVAAVGSGVVINDVLARDFFGTEDPVGRSITFFRAAQSRDDYGESIQATVVGVVEAERFFSLEPDPPRALFVPWSWMVWPSITVLARTDAESAASVIPALRRAIQQIDRDIPVAGPSRQAEWRPLNDFISAAHGQRRLMAGLITAFAASALLLAALGIFGVTAYLVTRRTREIGVRLAIGASPFSLAALVLGHSLRLALVGIVIGLPAAWAATRLLQGELFGVAANDPLTAAAAIVLFLATAVFAAALPTLRALRISPTEALRSE